LLNVAEATFLTWDGRRDTAYSQVFAPLESALEFNSSRLFVAQQVIRYYRTDYEAIFGPLPTLSYPQLAASDAGCKTLPDQATPNPSCPAPGAEDKNVTRIVANLGKAFQAYTRSLSCGRSAFDAWMDGDDKAMSAEAQAGAMLFVSKGGCDTCHSGPNLSDQQFHNLGVPGERIQFTPVYAANDPGASVGLAEVQKDWLNSKGQFSDGDDGRLDRLPKALPNLLGAFRTPSLRCVSRRPAFMHNGVFRSLEDLVRFFSTGGSAEGGYVGKSTNYPRSFTQKEQDQLVAFLTALDGDGPEPSTLTPPQLP
jgi:cytochrome c peroxidase